MPTFVADAQRRHPPPLMSIFIIASSSPIRSLNRHHRQTLPPSLNAIYIVHRHWTQSSLSTAATATPATATNTATTTGVVDRLTIVH